MFIQYSRVLPNDYPLNEYFFLAWYSETESVCPADNVKLLVFELLNFKTLGQKYHNYNTIKNMWYNIVD